MLPVDMSLVEDKKKHKMLSQEDNIYLMNPPKDLAELMHKFFITTAQTYSDKEAKKVQTTSGKRRSIEDLFLLTKSYFPNISYSKLKERVESLYPEKLGATVPHLIHNKCGQVLRIVHHVSTLTGFTEKYIRDIIPNNLEYKGK
jgi:hypothetical protein